MGNPLEGSSIGDFERWMERALGRRASLRRGSKRGTRGGGASFTGDPGRYVKKCFRYRNLHRGPFTAEENVDLEEGLYNGDFERYKEEGSSKWGISL